MAVLLGSLTATGSTTFFNSGDAGASQWQAIGSGSVVTISGAVLSSSFTTLKFAIYADSSGVPGAKLGETVTTSSNTAGTKTMALGTPVSVTSGTFYWLALIPAGGSVDVQMGAAGNYSYKTAAGSFTDPWGTSTDTGVGTALPMTGDAVDVTPPTLFVTRSNLRF